MMNDAPCGPCGQTLNVCGLQVRREDSSAPLDWVSCQQNCDCDSSFGGLDIQTGQRRENQASALPGVKLIHMIFVLLRVALCEWVHMPSCMPLPCMPLPCSGMSAVFTSLSSLLQAKIWQRGWLVSRRADYPRHIIINMGQG